MEIDETFQQVVERLVVVERLTDSLKEEIDKLKKEKNAQKEHPEIKLVLETAEVTSLVNDLAEENKQLSDQLKTMATLNSPEVPINSETSEETKSATYFQKVLKTNKSINLVQQVAPPKESKVPEQETSIIGPSTTLSDEEFLIKNKIKKKWNQKVKPTE